MVPRRVLAEVGGFDETLCAAEDWDMWARIAYRHPVARIEQPLLAVFEAGDSMSRDRLRQYLNDIEVITRWNPAGPGSYDTEKRLNPLIYQRYVLTFAILRARRLYRYGGREMVREFMDRLERCAGLSVVARGLIYSVLKCMGWN